MQQGGHIGRKRGRKRDRFPGLQMRKGDLRGVQRAAADLSGEKAVDGRIAVQGIAQQRAADGRPLNTVK